MATNKYKIICSDLHLAHAAQSFAASHAGSLQIMNSGRYLQCRSPCCLLCRGERKSVVSVNMAICSSVMNSQYTINRPFSPPLETSIWFLVLCWNINSLLCSLYTIAQRWGILEKILFLCGQNIKMPRIQVDLQHWSSSGHKDEALLSTD